MSASLTDRIEALELLVIAHLHAVARRNPIAGEETCNQALGHADQLVEDGMPAAGQHLRDLVGALRLQAD